MKQIGAYKTGKDYKKKSKHFELAVSHFWKIIKNVMLKKIVEVKKRSGKPREQTERHSKAFVFHWNCMKKHVQYLPKALSIQIGGFILLQWDS